MEGSTKTKIAVVVAAVILGAPTYMLSEGFLQGRVEDAWERGGGRPQHPYTDARPKDPLMAERLYNIAWVYKITFRSDQEVAIAKDWLRRYAGDDSEWPEPERLDSAFGEGRFWSDEHPRPEYYPHDPHRLTPKVLEMTAEFYEKKRLYAISRPLWQMILTHMRSIDAAVTADAEKAMLREKTRSF
jgi:hypothetical protein